MLSLALMTKVSTVFASDYNKYARSKLVGFVEEASSERRSINFERTKMRDE